MRKNETRKIKKVNWLMRLFGCRHKQMNSRPITIESESYRVCMNCGARRKFDLTTFKMHGGFYFATENQKEKEL